MASTAAIAAPSIERNGTMLVVSAASLGTVFEWYDFYLYGSLAANIGAHFFTAIADPNARFIFSLLAFAAGFMVRPFGALLFGRLGDLSGRKHTFLITILIMGTSTFLVGVLPDYGSIGVAAPVALMVLRLAQGLALGGEYGGAAIYVAEHAPTNRRGSYTAWIQTTASMGLLLSVIVIMVVQGAMSEAAFAAYGWRIPFLVSLILLVVSVVIRLKLNESPIFQRMKAEGVISKSPLRDSFTNAANLRLVLIALFALTMGQSVLWYSSQFYAQIFLTKTLLVPPLLANQMLAVALVLALPFFIIFGALSDRIGRRWLVIAGCLIGCVGYFPAFTALTHFANPALERALHQSPVTVEVDPSQCAVQFNPLGTALFRSSCDVAKAALVARGIPFTTEPGAAALARIVVAGQTVESYDATTAGAKSAAASFKASLDTALATAGYPGRADPAEVNRAAVVLLLALLIVNAAMVYGPLAAVLVELFPARIRYTSISLPYHIGNGWFGGLLPATVVAIVAATGNIYAGLWYPVLFSGGTVLLGFLFLPETAGRPID